MKVVVFSPYYPPAFRAGGPVKSISKLVQEPANPFSTLVVSRNWDLGESVKLRSSANRWVDTGEEWVWAYDRGLRQYLRAMLAVARQKPRLVYVNSLFDPWMGALPALGWRLFGSRNGDLVIAPRGQTGREALSSSAHRKRLLLRFWRWLARHKRVIVHAASEQEASDIEQVLGEVEIVLRPNDVGSLLPLLQRTARAADLRAVFVGRVVPIKGLLELLRSLRTVRCPLSLDVYGPWEDESYLGLCRQAAAWLPSHVKVGFEGPVTGDTVRSLLVKYDVMLNPTHGESFGQTLGESLSVGTPVVVADVTPWTAPIEEHGAGQIVGTGEWPEVVEKLSALDEEAWKEMRHAARRAYENWWQEAQGSPHLFQMVVDRHQH